MTSERERLVRDMHQVVGLCAGHGMYGEIAASRLVEWVRSAGFCKTHPWIEVSAFGHCLVCAHRGMMRQTHPLNEIFDYDTRYRASLHACTGCTMHGDDKGITLCDDVHVGVNWGFILTVCDWLSENGAWEGALSWRIGENTATRMMRRVRLMGEFDPVRLLRNQYDGALERKIGWCFRCRRLTSPCSFPENQRCEECGWYSLHHVNRVFRRRYRGDVIYSQARFAGTLSRPVIRLAGGFSHMNEPGWLL